MSDRGQLAATQSVAEAANHVEPRHLGQACPENRNSVRLSINSLAFSGNKQAPQETTSGFCPENDRTITAVFSRQRRSARRFPRLGDFGTTADDESHGCMGELRAFHFQHRSTRPDKFHHASG
jgi:hypothetical protein